MDYIIIQGSRSPGSDVWMTDDGIPLSFPTDLYDDGNPDNTVLVLSLTENEYGDEGFYFYAVSPENTYFEKYACEIEN